MNIEIINSCMPLIKSISNNFYGVEKEDLYQAGFIGVINAYKHFKDNNKTKFSTFAYTYIFGEMYKLANSKSIKYSKDITKLYKLVEKTRSYLTQTLGKIPTISEIANYLKINENDVLLAISYKEPIISLDQEIDDDTNLYNKISKDDTDYDTKIDLLSSISNLDDNSKKILLLRYFNDYSQQEVANLYGISQVTVSRNESKSLKKLRKYFVSE